MMFLYFYVEFWVTWDKHLFIWLELEIIRSHISLHIQENFNASYAFKRNVISISIFQTDQLTFSTMVSKNNRKQVAQKFYSILVLQKALAVSVEQEGDNGDIFVSRGPRFETAVF